VYQYAIEQFIAWYCSEPRLAFNRIVVVRYRMHLESRSLAANTINQHLAVVRRLAHEAADSGLLSPDLAAGISRVKGVKQLGQRSGNWLTLEQGSDVLSHAYGDTNTRGKPLLDERTFQQLLAAAYTLQGLNDRSPSRQTLAGLARPPHPRLPLETLLPVAPPEVAPLATPTDLGGFSETDCPPSSLAFEPSVRQEAPPDPELQKCVAGTEKAHTIGWTCGSEWNDHSLVWQRETAECTRCAVSVPHAPSRCAPIRPFSLLR
jgi:hypothetical protein